jgi:cytoskeleton protein RodZ
MTPENETVPPAAEPAPPAAPDGRPPSPGAMIRAARERTHLSIDELASQTKLARHTLEALERDDFNALLEPVYVRGYYRKCAKVLGVPEQEMLAAYQGRVEPRSPAAPSKLRLASGTELGSTSRLPIALAIFFATVAVAVCAFLWFWRSSNETVPPSIANRAGTTETVPVEAAPAPDTSSPLLPTVTEAPPTQSSAAAQTPTPSAPAPLPATPAATSTAPAGTATFTVTATSWVRINDGNGKSLVNGLLNAGETRSVSGTPPLSVFLGNAPGVKVEFEGKSLDLAKATRTDNTARFTLPQAP